MGAEHSVFADGKDSRRRQLAAAALVSPPSNGEA